MASVLASQLKTLAQQRQAALPTAVRKGKPSLLFDYQKAADVDLQTIYDLACQGLDELTRLEPRFRPYRESLFSRASLDINPDLQTKEFLLKLSESIYGFCCLLSNYFLLAPSFKVLEYLIRRYKANERNVDALLTAALPYHSTNEFVRLVQTMALGTSGSMWGWLAKMQTSGASLPRDLLARRCVNDRQLLLFICKTASQLGGGSPTNPSDSSAAASALRASSRVYLSFYAVLLCEVLAIQPKIDEDLLAALLPYLLEGLGRSSLQDYRAATLMAVAELFSRATLGKDFIKVLLNTMIKHAEPVPEHVRTVLLVMAHMSVTQPHIRSLSDKTLKYLSALPNVVSELAALTQRGNIRMGPLLVLIARSLVGALVSSGGAAGVSSGSGRRAEGDLLALAHSGAVRGEPARSLAAALLEAGTDAKTADDVRESCQRILRVLDQRYPDTTDAAVNAFLEPLRVHRQQQQREAASAGKTPTNADGTDAKGNRKRRKTDGKGKDKTAADQDDANDDDAHDDTPAVESADAAAAALPLEERARFDFVRATFASGGYSAPCAGTMMTLAAALVAPQAAVRRLALQQLDADLTSSAAAAAKGTDADSDVSEARSALTTVALNCLRDDDLGVVVAALGLSCLKELPPAALLDAFGPLVDRLGEYLYGSGKLPQLKAARQAATKVVGLLRHVGVSPSASEVVRRSVALHLLALMLPSRRDPRIAMEAARNGAKLVDLPLFSELKAEMDAVAKKLNPPAGEARGGKPSSADGKGDDQASGKKPNKKAAQQTSAVEIERGIVSALAKGLTADPEAGGAAVTQLVAASAAAAVLGGEAAEASARRVQHVLLLGLFAAAIVSSSAGPAAKPTGGSSKALSATSIKLLRSLCDLSETLLPYARLGLTASAGTEDEKSKKQQQEPDWLSTFTEQISQDTGLPTELHAPCVLADPVASHAAVILGALRAGLMRLPEAASPDAASAGLAAAKRALGLLSSLGYSPAGLFDLPLLVVTRSVPPPSRSGFLSGLYSAPAGVGGITAALQNQVLHIRAETATADGACSWLVTLLPALSSPEASVRSAACDCLTAAGVLLEAPNPQSPTPSASTTAVKSLPVSAASALCSSLLAHRKLICRDPEAVSALLSAALTGVAAKPPAPASAKKSKSGAAGAAPPTPAAVLALPAATASDLAAYLTASLAGMGVDPAGVNTVCAVLTCLDKGTTSSTTAAAATSLSSSVLAPLRSELFKAGSAYLSRLVSRLKEDLSSATPLDAKAVTLLVTSLFTPASVAAAVAVGEEAALGPLAEAAELRPAPASAPAAVEALAAARLAAVQQVSNDLFAPLPVNGVTVRELFAVLLGSYEGDLDEEVRRAARAALEAIPLSAELLVPLLNPSADDTAAATVRSKKKSKKAAVAADAAPSAPPPLDPAALRDAVSVLELLQWRTGIRKSGLLVGACQSLLQRLLPVVSSIASVLKADDDQVEDDARPEAEAAEDGSAKSSLAGYAATLALQVLTALARSKARGGGDGGADVEMEATDGTSVAFDLELAVRTAREAPDAAVRNAALGLLAALATTMPEAALSHVLQVLAVVNQSAALQDDEHSRAVGATALASVVPAWVAAGRSAEALWEQVVASLPALPPHRRTDVLFSLLRALPAAEEGLADGLLVLLRHTADSKPAAGKAKTPAKTPGGKTPKGTSKKVEPVEEQQPNTEAETSPSDWLPELASQLALQVELPVRLACCSRVMEMALSASGQRPVKALPRTVVVFVTTQLKLKSAISAASASFRRPDPDPALDLGCRRLMEAALAQMQLLQPNEVRPGAPSAVTPNKESADKKAASHLAVLAASRGLYGLFSALQGVMAADTYLQSLLTLAEHPADKVKRRAIKLFTDKVRGVKAEIEDQIELPQRVRNAKLRQASDAAARACAMLPPLLQPPAESAGANTGASPLTRQLALVALATIAAEFGTLQHAALLAGVPAVLAATKDNHASIRASALATAATFVRALQARLVPVLPATVAAAVAAADSAWARLARAAAGGAGDAPDDKMQDDAVGSEDNEDEPPLEGDDSDEELTGAGRRRSRKSERDDAALELSSALACLNALVETLGGFLSPHLPAVLAILLNPRVLACRAAGCDQFAASIRGRLPTAVPTRLLLPALYERLEPCLAAACDAPDAASGAAPTVALLQMMAAAAASLEPKLAAQYADGMLAFLLRALDVRQRRPKALAVHGEAAIDAVEAAAIGALVALVMKLSEARFKPLFLRLLEWASTVSVSEAPGAGSEPSYMGRMVALFGVVNALADRLRSVLVPYYRHLLDLCIQHLGGEEGSGGGKGAARSKKKQRRGAAEDSSGAAAADGGADADAVATYRDQQLCLSWLLRLRIVRALHRCFLHDTVGFIDADRFTRLQPALVSQLDAEPPEVVVPFLRSTHHTDPDLAAYVSLGKTTRVFTAPDGAASLGPLGAAAVGSLLAMAVAANSDALWKPLNHATLMLTRSASSRTRALALEVVAQLVDRLREEYLVLLPEALPFLSELLEDVDAAVAARVREVVAQLEEISGEKLDEYLKV